MWAYNCMPALYVHLLEGLRRLREGVKLAGVHAARHHEVAGAFGGGLDQQRGFNFAEVHVVQKVANVARDLVAQEQTLLDGVAANVQVPVRHAHLSV